MNPDQQSARDDDTHDAEHYRNAEHYRDAVEKIRDLARTAPGVEALASIQPAPTPPTIVVCLDTETYGSAIERARRHEPPVVLVVYRPGSGRVCAIRPDDVESDGVEGGVEGGERPEFWNDPLAAIVSSGWLAVADLPPTEFADSTVTTAP